MAEKTTSDFGNNCVFYERDDENMISYLPTTIANSIPGLAILAGVEEKGDFQL